MCRLLCGGGALKAGLQLRREEEGGTWELYHSNILTWSSPLFPHNSKVSAKLTEHKGLTRGLSCWWLWTSRTVCLGPVWYTPTGSGWCPDPAYCCSPQTCRGRECLCSPAPWWWWLLHCSWRDRDTKPSALDPYIWHIHTHRPWTDDRMQIISPTLIWIYRYMWMCFSFFFLFWICEHTLQRGRRSAAFLSESQCSLASGFCQMTCWWEPADALHQFHPESCICTHIQTHTHQTIIHSKGNTWTAVYFFFFFFF